MWRILKDCVQDFIRLSGRQIVLRDLSIIASYVRPTYPPPRSRRSVSGVRTNLLAPKFSDDQSSTPYGSAAQDF